MKFRPFSWFADVLFPRRCVRCRRGLREGVICDACRAAIPVGRTLYCGECRRPAQAIPAASPCHPDFPCVLGAATEYENPPTKATIHALKFDGIRDAAEPLARLLEQYFAEIGLAPGGWTIIPIPLSRARWRSRGFNQSEAIAAALAGRLGFAIDTKILTRIRNTKPQSETKDVFERRENVRGCFAVSAPAAAAGRRIILLDDVVTSGATFREAAQALRAGGAAQILAIAVAKA